MRRYRVKIFTKLYIGILIILIFVLLVSGFFMVRATLKMNMDSETGSDIERHNLFQTALENYIILETKDKIADSATIRKAVVITKGNNDLKVSVLMDDEKVFSDEKTSYTPADLKEDLVSYHTVERDDRVYMEVGSKFVKRGITYTCITMKDITGIIENNNSLRMKFRIIYVIVLIIGTAFALWFSIRITKPIRRLDKASKAIAAGDYTRRIEPVTADELGSLTASYNSMADTIQEKMDELALSVQQREDFIAAFAHETKTPMTSIIGYADLLYQGRLKEQDAREAAEVILNEGQRLQALSQKLLELIVLERTDLETEEIHIPDMIEDIRRTAGQLSGERQTHITFEATEDYVRMEYDLIKTVVLNLIDNAIKAEATGITVEGKPSEDAYAITIRDDGIGIPADKLRRVKEAFYMADKSRSRSAHGAGLGLALAEKIITLHDGRLDLESEEGKGTTVRILLPFTKK